MRRNRALLEVGTALLLLALGGSSWAATVRVTDVALEPETLTVNRGEEIVWLDATSTRTAQVNLRNGERARAYIGVAEDVVGQATLGEPGTYDYRAYTGVGGPQPRPLNGRIVVK